MMILVRLQRLGVCALAGMLVASMGCCKGHEMFRRPLSSNAEPFTKVTVPGMELFVETGRQLRADDYSAPTRGAARIEGSRKVLRGKTAFDAARARVGNDPGKLAILAMLFLDRGAAGEVPWTHHTGTSAGNDDGVHPPSLHGDTLEYWRNSGGMVTGLVRCRVALTSGKVACEDASAIEKAAQMARDPYAVIDKELASHNIYVRVGGVQDLAKIGDDKARKRLIDLALNAYWPEVRVAAAGALGKLPGPGVAPALERMEKYDRSQDARLAAYRALEELKAAGHKP